jgi:hypothetical protein
MDLPVFDTPWYAEMIERFGHDTGKAKSVNPAIDGLGTCILASACILAQALDGVAKSLDGVADSISLLEQEKLTGSRETQGPCHCNPEVKMGK